MGESAYRRRSLRPRRWGLKTLCLVGYPEFQRFSHGKLFYALARSLVRRRPTDRQEACNTARRPVAPLVAGWLSQAEKLLNKERIKNSLKCGLKASGRSSNNTWELILSILTSRHCSEFRARFVLFLPPAPPPQPFSWPPVGKSGCGGSTTLYSPASRSHFPPFLC